MKIAIRHILVTLAWVGLLLGHRAWPARTGQLRGQRRRARQRSFRPGDRPNLPCPTACPTPIRRWSANIRSPIGGVFGDTPPGGLRILRRRKLPAADVGRRNLGRGDRPCRVPAINAWGRIPCPPVPFPPAASSSPTAASTTQDNFTQYLNDAVQTIGFGSPHAESRSSAPRWA